MSDRTRFLIAVAVVLVLAGSIAAFEFFSDPRNPAQPVTDEGTSVVAVLGATTPTPRPSLTPLPTFTPIPTATPIPNGVDDTAAGISYGGWAGVADPGASGGQYHAATDDGRTLTYQTEVSATVLALLAYRGPDQGQATVFIDRENKGVLDFYAATPEYAVVQTWEGLSESTHEIRIRVTGRANAASTGTQVRVDGLRIGESVVEDTDPAFTYLNWVGESNSAAYGGSYRRAQVPDAEMSFTFTGTAFAWITLRCPRCGQAEVIVDEALLETVDLYSETDVWQSALVFDELSAGGHTVIIRVLGTSSTGSPNPQVVFDGFGVP